MLVDCKKDNLYPHHLNLQKNIFQDARLEGKQSASGNDVALTYTGGCLTKAEEELHRSFAPAGQSTQMIIGASGESDYNLIQTTQKLYQAYDLKRVFYSAYIPVNKDKLLPTLNIPPLVRENRLYQADWLLRFYGFDAEEFCALLI